MESTGQPGRIQLSQDTRDLIVAAGKEKWVREREDQVIAKGLGAVKTYWFSMHAESAVSTETGLSVGSGSSTGSTEEAMALLSCRTLPPRSKRLVRWNVEMLSKQLKLVVARRLSVSKRQANKANTRDLDVTLRLETACPLDEVQDVLRLPKFDAKAYENHVDPDTVEIPEGVLTQLHCYVGKIASLYRDNNPFHSYEHASHVTMSVSKLLSRIVQPTSQVNTDNATDKDIARGLHDHTFGIASDPLTHFACVVSLIIV